MKSKIILIGAPGAGKGTQAKLIESKYHLPHISTGDIFRKNIREKTPVGLKALVYIDKGQLVPDDITVEIVAQRLKESDCANGYILDGFPRTLAQAEALEKFEEIDIVIDIVADESKLIDRLTGRRVCGQCGESYHVSTKKDSVCDKCGATLIHREDDREDVIRNRLEVFEATTKPIVDFYRSRGKLFAVDGMGEINRVFDEVCGAIEE